jgi:hypothetical protein
MTDFLDELVSKTKERYKTQEVERRERLQEQELRTSLGADFFRNLKMWLRTNTDNFNRKFTSEVFVLDCEGPQDILTIRSKETLNKVSLSTGI